MAIASWLTLGVRRSVHDHTTSATMAATTVAIADATMARAEDVCDGVSSTVLYVPVQVSPLVDATTEAVLSLVLVTVAVEPSGKATLAVLLPETAPDAL